MWFNLQQCLLLISSTVSLSILAIPLAAVAQVSPSEIAESSEETLTEEPSIAPLSLSELENPGSAALEQLTSVSQLSDVQPTDWAFQALQSLVERYGCIVGYPDGTYRGQSALTRYEFAAGLNSCLDRISELLAASTADLVSRDDLAALQRLQEEFAAELAILRGRVDSLEARAAELEENQFSTTTVLEGEVQIIISGIGNADDDLVTAAGNPVPEADQIVAVDRVRLGFITSFTGEDELETTLEAGNFETEFTSGITNGEDEEQTFAGNPFPADPLGFNAGGDADNDFDIDDLIYTFPVGDRVELQVGATGLDIDDPVNDISPFTSSSSGSISEFGDVAVYEQAFPGSGAGVGGSISLLGNDSFDVLLEFAYVADDPSDPSEKNGLFNGAYAALGQLTLASDWVDLALAYVNSYVAENGVFPRLASTYELSGAQIANTYGGQVNFKLFDGRLQIGGGAAFSDVTGIRDNPDYEAWSWQGTLAVTDVGSEGSLLGVLAGVPTYTRDLPNQSRDTGFLVEGFYRYRLNDNIALTPSVIWIADPYNVNENDDIIIGSLRTVFSF